MNAAEYRRSLDDGRRLFFDGQRIDDVADHPKFRAAVDRVAQGYEDAERLLSSDAYKVPRSAADLRARIGINPVRVSSRLLTDLARAEGQDGDRLVRQDLAQLHILDTVARWTALRARALQAVGGDTRGFANMGKLAESRLGRFRRELSGRVLGPAAMLHAYRDEDRVVLDRATGRPELAAVTYWMLFAQVSSIAGGTDEIQHNVIGERALDLPREPGVDRVVPFRELPRNA